MDRLQTLAQEARSYLYRGKREVDGIGKILLRRRDKAPDWVDDLYHAAHNDGRMFPDDWRYEFIGDALDCLAEDDDRDPTERFAEWSDGSYVYTHEQTSWLGSRADRYGYCDEAVKELGGDALDTMGRVRAGMLLERLEVFGIVLRCLRDRANEEEEAG